MNHSYSSILIRHVSRQHYHVLENVYHWNMVAAKRAHGLTPAEKNRNQEHFLENAKKMKKLMDSYVF